MDAQAFRSPLAKFALALWMGCLHWPLTIPFVCALPLLPRSSQARLQAWSMLILFALGWTANSAQEAFDPLLTAPKTARWTCKHNVEANARKPQFTCVTTAGNAYTVEAEVAPPLHSSFLGTLWPFRLLEMPDLAKSKAAPSHGSEWTAQQYVSTMERTPSTSVNGIGRLSSNDQFKCNKLMRT